MVKKVFVDINDTSEIEKKLAQHDNKEEKEAEQEIVIAKPKKVEVSSTPKEKMEAMARFGLKPETTAVTAYLEDEPKFHLDLICSRFKKDIKEVVLRYVLKGIEDDLKGIGIFDPKK